MRWVFKQVLNTGIKLGKGSKTQKTMKKQLVLASIALFTGLSAFAQKTKVKVKTKPAVSVSAPAVVKTGFGEAYADTKATWSKTPSGNYVATFKDADGNKQTAEYSAKGEKRNSRTYVNVENTPEAIKTSLTEKYPDYDLNNVVKTETVNEGSAYTFYKVEIKSKSDGTKKQVLVSPEGTIAD